MNAALASVPEPGAAEPEPRRLTPTERLHEVTMASLSRRPSEPESSVSLTRNAKGVTQCDVTVRGPDAAACKALAVELYDALRMRYPLPSGFTGAEGEPGNGGAK